MRLARISGALAAAVIVVASPAAAAFNCYVIVDSSNEVIYQASVPPLDLSDDGAPARDALRARGQQLVIMDADRCPAIDRGRIAGKGGPAPVEEIVAGMRSAVSFGSSGSGTQRAAPNGNGGITLPRITVPRATGGGVSPSGPPSGMSIR